MYKNRLDIEFHKKELIEKQKQDILDQSVKTNENSAVIVENQKRKRLEKIFQIMDSDGDGLITPNKIELEPLSTDVLEALAPLLIEMDQLNAELDFDLFYEAADRLIKVRFKFQMEI